MGEIHAAHGKKTAGAICTNDKSQSCIWANHFEKWIIFPGVGVKKTSI